MDLGGLSWLSITVVGVAILAIVMAYAALRNKADSPPSIPRLHAPSRVWPERQPPR